MHTLIHAYIRTYVRTYVHKYIHKYIRIIHTYVHVQHMYYACCSHKVAAGLPFGTKDTAPFAISAGLHPGGVTTFPLAGLRWRWNKILQTTNSLQPGMWYYFFPLIIESLKLPNLSQDLIWKRFWDWGIPQELASNPPRTGLKTSSWWRIFCGFSLSYI